MTNNDELALKLKAAADKARLSERRSGMEMAVDSYDFIEATTPANILALLAERDADKKLIAELNDTLERECEKSRRMASRIAELEARTVSVKLPDSDEYLGKYGDNMSDMAAYENAVYKSLADAGIKLEVGE